MKYQKNKVSSCVNEICEGQKVKTPKLKYTPEKVFVGYKKSSKSKGKKKKSKGGCGCGCK
jgi:hypothetical protein